MRVKLDNSVAFLTGATSGIGEAIVHGLSHIPSQLILGPAGISYLIIGMLYGVPMGMLFAKKDLEHAIGYHYFIDLIRFLVAFLIL